MRKATPIGVEGDAVVLHDQVCQMFVRCAKLARKRITKNSTRSIDLEIGPAAIGLIVAMEDFFHGKDMSKVLERINKIFPSR